MLVLRQQAVCLPFLSPGKFSTQDTNDPFQKGNQGDGGEQRQTTGTWEGTSSFQNFLCDYKLLRSGMLKLELQYFGHLIRRVDSLEKTDAGRD